MEVDQTATFHCAAVGIPAPKVEWFLETTKVSEGSTLTIEDVSLVRGGSTYVCLVSSEAGSVSALAKLIVFGKMADMHLSPPPLSLSLSLLQDTNN